MAIIETTHTEKLISVGTTWSMYYEQEVTTMPTVCYVGDAIDCNNEPKQIKNKQPYYRMNERW